MTDWTDDLALAHTLADRADEVTMARFLAADLVVESKPDLTPVSDADKAAEGVIRAGVAAARPDDAFLGEESGVTGSGPRRWVIDPIDGTKNYVRGVPVWASLIALQYDERTVVGVVSAPALGRRWWAGAGHGAWTRFGAGEPRTCRVSKIGAITNASLAYSSLSGWEQTGRLPQVLELFAGAWRTRAYGDFWSHMLVAEGAVDASFEPELSLWDVAALHVIVTEAGGSFTDLSGVERCDGGNLVCSNGLLHSDVLNALTTAS